MPASNCRNLPLFLRLAERIKGKSMFTMSKGIICLKMMNNLVYTDKYF